MEIIEFDRWKPSLDNPRKLEYVGQRTAEEVFSELKHRLEGMGYLPDECQRQAENVDFRRNRMSFFGGQHSSVYSPYTPLHLPA